MEMDEFTRDWIIENSKEVLREYAEGITVRQLYYRLVSRGLTNTIRHYKRVVAAMTKARWDSIVDMEAFIDRERSVHGETKSEEKELDVEIERGKSQLRAWMQAYHLDRWSNQPKYVEVWVEKKALQGVFEGPCDDADVGLAPCKGYPSLTFLNEAVSRFDEAAQRGQDVIILYFGDYDPSGEDIPRSIQANLARMGSDVEVIRIALNAELIADLGLPGAPPKMTDSRTACWDGDSAVELDAVEPKKLQEMCENSIEEHFDEELCEELEEKEEKEREEYQKQLKDYVNDLADKDDDNGEE